MMKLGSFFSPIVQRFIVDLCLLEEFFLTNVKLEY